MSKDGERLSQNGERRQAQRQKRGVQRVDEILHAAGALFAECGYDNVTMHLIAARAAITSGSLYQFFPNKEAVTQAFAAMATQRLHEVYDAMLTQDMADVSFTVFLDEFITRLLAFNRAYPGYLELELAATQSPTLIALLTDLHRGVQARLDALMARYWQNSTREQRQIPLLVSYRLFLVMLPILLQEDNERGAAILQEMRGMLQRYWAPFIAESGG